MNEKVKVRHGLKRNHSKNIHLHRVIQHAHQINGNSTQHDLCKIESILLLYA